MFFNSAAQHGELVKLLVWQKASAISGKQPSEWRMDDYGREIFWEAYGDRDSRYGWEIDHIYPKSKGGSDSLSNLRPLHWISNLLKSDKC